MTVRSSILEFSCSAAQAGVESAYTEHRKNHSRPRRSGWLLGGEGLRGQVAVALASTRDGGLFCTRRGADRIDRMTDS